MDCRETQSLLTAFHDGELPAADRARVEAHLRGCPECGALLTDLARADQAAGVPDPGPAYWKRFNARVMERVERGADGPKGTILRPKHGWMRQQLRYLVPAAAAAALVVGIVRYGGMDPGAPLTAVPPAAVEPAIADPAGQRTTKAEPGSGGHGRPGAEAGRDAPGSKTSARGGKTAESTEVARRVSQSSVAGEQGTAMTREERDRLADRSRPAGIGEAAGDRAAAPAGPGRPVAGAGGDAADSVAPAADSPPVTAAEGMRPGVPVERKRMEGAAAGGMEQEVSGKAKPAPGMRIAKETSPASPCERARSLAEGKRIREAEDAQRACLAGDLPAPSREKGLVFLAELLDRQARFAEADAVIAEVDRRFPQSPPLELYRQQRPMVQKHPMAVPGTR
jgi:hypothetical protein